MEPSDSRVAKIQPLRRDGGVERERQLWARFRAASTDEEFYEGWLGLECHAIPGVEAGLVLVRGSEDFEPIACWPAGPPRAHLLAAGRRVLKAPRPVALQLDPHGDASAAAPRRTVLAHPFEAGGELAGLVALEVSPRSDEDLARALRELGWGSAWLELQAMHEGAVGTRTEQVEALLDLISTPLEHERFQASATAFLNELAGRFRCERVSLGFVEHGNVKLRAVSHSAQFGERANLTRATEAAMDEALDQESLVLWPTPDGVSQVARAHEELAAESEARTICSCPLAHGTRFCGALTFERAADEPFTPAELRLVEAAAALAGPMLDIQRRDDRWLPTKALESLRGVLERLVGPRHVALKLGVSVVVALVTFLALARGDYRVTADTMLEAQVLRAAVAPFDSYIDEAPVRAGDRVAEGDLLARLDDRELLLERASLQSQLEQLSRRYRQAMAEREASTTRILSAQLEQIRAQLQLADDQLAKTRITSPFEGIVVTGDLSQNLGSPVQRGELLFEVAPLDAYRVVLSVDERDIDELAVGQTGSLALFASPEESVPFTVERITPVSSAAEGENTFRVEARLAYRPPALRPGMEGVAKVEIDRRRLLWIWTHEIVDWVRLFLWTWLP